MTQSPPQVVTSTCQICSHEMHAAGHKRCAFDDRSYQLQQCPNCWYARVQEPRTDFEALYGDEYYRGQGADPLTDYESEMTDPASIRVHEWAGVLDVARAVHHVDERTEWLDLGCGLGGLVRHVRANGVPNAIGSEDGRARARALEYGVPCVTSEELRERESAFDVITSIEVIEHVIDPIEFLAGVALLLKPGGIFFFTTGNAHPHRSKLTSWPYVIPAIHVSFFEPATIEAAFRTVGLTPEHHGYKPGYTDIIRYKTVKNLPRGLQRVADRCTPWKVAAPLIDRRYGVSAFPVGRKPA